MNDEIHHLSFIIHHYVLRRQNIILLNRKMIMKNWNDDDFKIPFATIPTDVFDGVKTRIITTRIAVQKQQKQFVVISSVLLLVCVVNCGIILMQNGLFAPKQTTNAAEIMYNNLFKISQTPFDE
jgi:hypothetical protein